MLLTQLTGRARAHSRALSFFSSPGRASPEQISPRRLRSLSLFIRENRTMMRGLSVVQLLLVTLSASLTSAREARENGGGNFLEDEQQWLSTVHQYSRTVKHWNRFRDVSFSAVTLMPVYFKPMYYFRHFLLVNSTEQII